MINDDVSFKRALDNNFDLFYKLYFTYQQELQAVSGQKWDIIKKDDYLKSEIEHTYVGKRSFLIYIKDELVGLIVYQDAFWASVLYIDNFYIIPKYRKKRLGTAVIEYLMKDFKDETRILLYVLKGNYVGESFWNNVAKKMNWKPYFNSEIRINDEDEEMLKRKLWITG